MQQMRASQETQMTKLYERMDRTEAKMCSMEEETRNTLTVMESKLETYELSDPSADAVARDKIAKLENTIREQLAGVSQNIENLSSTSATRPPPTAAASSSSPGQEYETLVIIGGLQQETPKGEVERIWVESIQPRVAEAVDLTGATFEPPYLLSSVLHLRCSTPAQAKSTIAFIRKHQPRIPFGTAQLSIYATIQKPREIKDNNRTLLQSAETLQKYLQPHIKAVPSYEAVCWRSSSVVLSNHRVCNVTRDANNNNALKITFFPNWYSSDMFVNTAAVIERSVKKLLSPDE